MENFEPYLGTGVVDIPISNSEIQTYKDCKRKWWLTYYRGLALKQKNHTGPLPLGVRVHKTLEVFYKSEDELDIVDIYNDLFFADSELFYASADSNFEDLEDAFLSEGELGRIVVEGYAEWLKETSADVEYDVIDVEEAMSYSVLGGRVNLIGKTDMRLIDKTDGMVYIGDFKTAAQLKPYDDVTHMSEQLMLYTLLAQLTGDKKVAGGVYIVLKKNKRTARAKPPFYKRYVVRFNQKTLDSFWIRLMAELKEMVDVRDRLDAGESHLTAAYPSPSNECVWKCPFFNACPMFDDGSDAEGWLRDNTEVGNPYERYEGDEVATAP